MVKIIMSQTDMSRERVVTELERTNYDLKRVIRDYMRGGDSEVKDCAVSDAAGAATATATATAASSTNQLRFSEIRNFMDKSSEMYYRRKEMERIYNEVLEKKRAAAAAAAASEAATETTAASKL
jgi:activator of HSP90 ATPase